MSEDAHDAIAAFPEFITEWRGDIAVKVEMLLLYTNKNTLFPARHYVSAILAGVTVYCE